MRQTMDCGLSRRLRELKLSVRLSMEPKLWFPKASGIIGDVEEG